MIKYFQFICLIVVQSTSGLQMMTLTIVCAFAFLGLTFPPKWWWQLHLNVAYDWFFVVNLRSIEKENCFSFSNALQCHQDITGQRKFNNLRNLDGNFYSFYIFLLRILPSSFYQYQKWPIFLNTTKFKYYGCIFPRIVSLLFYAYRKSIWWLSEEVWVVEPTHLIVFNILMYRIHFTLIPPC